MFFIIKRINLQERFPRDSRYEFQNWRIASISGKLCNKIRYLPVELAGNMLRSGTVGFVLLGAESMNMDLSIVYS